MKNSNLKSYVIVLAGSVVSAGMAICWVIGAFGAICDELKRKEDESEGS